MLNSCTQLCSPLIPISSAAGLLLSCCYFSYYMFSYWLRAPPYTAAASNSTCFFFLLPLLLLLWAVNSPFEGHRAVRSEIQVVAEYDYGGGALLCAYVSRYIVCAIV